MRTRRPYPLTLRRGGRYLGRAAALLLAVTAVAATAAVPALAATARTSATSSTLPRPGASRVVRLPDNTSVVLPKPYDEMSYSQLAKHGIAPGVNGIRRVTASAYASLKLRPLNASGWNDNVWISIQSYNGKGLDVTGWTTVADPGAYTCTWADYWENGELWAESNEVCGTAFTSNANNLLPHIFGNGTTLCNTWITVLGRPCEIVHS
jgi:hypothetical protein